MDKCNHCRPHGAVHMEMDKMVDTAATAEELSEVLDIITAKLPDFASQTSLSISAMVETEVKDLLQRLSLGAYASSGQKSIGDGCVNSSTIENVSADIKNRDNWTFDNLRTGMYGGMAGATMGQIIGATIGSIIPGIGTAFGAVVGGFIGGAWGGWKAGISKEQAELKAAKQQAKNGVSQTIASIHIQLQDMLGKLLRDVEQKVNMAFKQYVRQHSSDLQRRQKELMDRGNMSAAEVSKKRRENAEMDNAMHSIMRVLQPWMSGDSCN